MKAHLKITTDAYDERGACPLYTAIAVIDGRWKPMIYQRLMTCPHGFGQLKRAMPRVTTKVLRQQLRQMVADDLVARQELTPPRLGVRYRLTPYGRSLMPVFEALWRWGARHLVRPGARLGTSASAPTAVLAQRHHTPAKQAQGGRRT
jgi:DNA-binding HxlR family transcriptional regulator